jgi:hypothetical protein
LRYPDPPGAITVFQRKPQRDGMSVQFIAQGASMQLFALTQDEKSARHHHQIHGDGQKQNQSGAKAHAVAPSLKRRLAGRPIAAR